MKRDARHRKSIIRWETTVQENHDLVQTEKDPNTWGSEILKTRVNLPTRKRMETIATASREN